MGTVPWAVNLARLTGTELKNSANMTLNAHTYALNNANQRTRQTRTDGSYVDYGYDDIGQLLSATGKNAQNAPRLQETLGYSYDPAGNLHSRANNALVQTFNNNTLNELTTVTRSGTLTVAGDTTGPATSVTVNGVTAQLESDLTFAATGLSLADGTNTFTAVAQDSSGRQDTNTISVNLPATVSFQYDGNGNLLSDGSRNFTYDYDDRLISVGVPDQWKVTFTYDGLGRLRQRQGWTWISSGGNWIKNAETRYIYDGNLIIQERDQNNTPIVTYTRGLELGGGAPGTVGGIGGLLARTDNLALISQTGDPHAYYHADGNGNVTMLTDSRQQVAAKYIYDPYGNVIAKSGPLADANIYRFSSKEFHDRIGLYSFGRRFYDPNLQRWPNRDPIGIEGGINLYRYVGNRPVNSFDPWGEAEWLDKLLAWGQEFFFETIPVNSLGSLSGAQWDQVSARYGQPQVVPVQLDQNGFWANWLAEHKDTADFEEVDPPLAKGLGVDPNELAQGKKVIKVTIGIGAVGSLIVVGGTGLAMMADIPLGSSAAGNTAKQLLSWARRYHINADSTAGKQLLNNLDMTVDKYISLYREAKIRQEFPSQALRQTVRQAIEQGASDVRKLLIDSRWAK